MVYFHDMIERNLTARIVESLQDTPVVYLQGARQTGKSTLAQHIAKEHHPAQYLSLDSMAVLSAAESDPEGFVAGLSGNVVLDEVQRVPRWTWRSSRPSMRTAGQAAFCSPAPPARWLCRDCLKRWPAGSNCTPFGPFPQGK